MSIWIDVAQGATVVNLLLLGVLGWIWGRNYWRLRSKHALGLFVFAALLFVENGFALYVYNLDPILSVWYSNTVPDVAWKAMTAFTLLETAAIAFLAWTALD